MRVIITGGTGLIGRALSSNLIQDKYEVIVLSRNPSRHTDMPSGVKVEKWDAVSAEGWGHLADGAHAIINLAGAGIADGRWTEKRKELLISSRVNAGKAVVEAVAAAKIKPEVVIQASGVGYYGTHANNNKLSEDAAQGNDFPAEICAVWEPATAPVKEMGVRHVITRIGVVLSNDGGALPKMMMPFNTGIGGPVGSGEQWMSWIHIDDAVTVMRYLMATPSASGVYNVTSPGAVVNRVFAGKIGTVLSKPAFLPAPTFVMKLLFKEMSTLLLDGQRVYPSRLMTEKFRFKYTDVETALRNLLVPANV